jgi:hypothetical protein
MATEREREEKLNKNIAGGKKKLSGVLATRKRSINGAISEYTAKDNFVTNAAVRNKLYSELAKEYKYLNESVSEWTIDGVNKSAKDFFGYAKEDLPKGALPTFGAFSQKYIDDIVGEINPAAVKSGVAINAQIGGMQQKDIRTLRAAVSTTLAEGAVEGLTNPQMADRMQKRIVGKVGQFQFIDKAGRNWSADNYFGMLNRTMHANAARESYIDAATKEAGFDLYQIEGGITGSSVENANDPCDQWAGRIVSMTGDTKGYPTYQDAIDAGVFHPNCVHFIRAIMPSEIPAAKKEQREERVIATTLGSK